MFDEHGRDEKNKFESIDLITREKVKYKFNNHMQRREDKLGGKYVSYWNEINNFRHEGWLSDRQLRFFFLSEKLSKDIKASRS